MIPLYIREELDTSINELKALYPRDSILQSAPESFGRFISKD